MKNRFVLFILILLVANLLSSCSNINTPVVPTVVNLVATAEIQADQYKLEDAFANYSKDIQNNKDLARAYTGRGEIYLAWRRFDEAISDFNHALDLVRTPEVLVQRCTAYRLLSKLQLAEADCKEAIKLKPDFVDAYISMALLQLEQNNNSDALKTIQDGILQDPKSGQAYLALSQIQSAQGDLAASLISLTKAIELQPKEAQFYCERAFLYYSTAQIDKSKQDYQKALEVGIQGKDDICIEKAQSMLNMLGK